MMKQIREFYFDSTVRDSKYLIAGIRAKSNQKRPKDTIITQSTHHYKIFG